jgi:hypothetical protein
MTVNRNKRQDRERTIEQILKPVTLSPEIGVNWLGHRTTSKASTLDAMLLHGTTITEMEKVRGAVENHIRHLEQEHGLTIKTDGETYKIDRLNLGITE